jgi:hypothetical protein
MQGVQATPSQAGVAQKGVERPASDAAGRFRRPETGDRRSGNQNGSAPQ